MTASRLELRSEVEDIKEENEIKIEGGERGKNEKYPAAANLRQKERKN